jgi:hypothetical protein
MRWIAAGLLIGLCGGGCVRTTGNAPVGDGRPADAATIDVAPEVGGADAADATKRDGVADAADAARRDGVADTTASSDQTARDLAAGDAQAGDASPGDGGGDGLAPSCTVLYGQAPEFLLCEERAEACTFYTSEAAGDAVSCVTSCAAGGGTCLSAGDDLADGCEVGAVIPCDEAHRDLVCGCSRP